MNEMVKEPVAEDAAWAAINTPLPADELKVFCRDVERLLRINPMLEFSKFQRLDRNRYQCAGRNISQVPAFEFYFTFNVSETSDGLRIEYENGIKSSTVLQIESAPQGSKLTITDHYDRLPAEEREQHLGEVDRSLVVWAEYLQCFLLMWAKWRRFGWWRWYMRRVWQPMKPQSRRITYILLWITAVEIALIALGVAIYFAEYA